MPHAAPVMQASATRSTNGALAMGVIGSSSEHLHELVDGTITEFPERRALVDGTGAMTYAELDSTANRVAQELRSRGIAPSEPVIVTVRNRAVDVASFLGVWRAGGVVVPLHADAAAATVRAIERICRARLAVRRDDDSVELVLADEPASIPELDGAAFVVFTSGTTGAPKGVIQLHDRYCAKLRAIDAAVPFEGKGITLNPLQLTFAFGQWTTLLTLAHGGTVEFPGRFDAGAVAARIGAGGVGRFPVVPSMLRMLCAANTAVPANTVFMAGGEPLSAALGAQVLAAFPGSGLSDLYGLTESNSADFIVTPEEYDSLAGTIGRPRGQVTYRITDSEGCEVTAGEVGELQIASAYMMRGYLGAPDLTAAAFSGDFLRTGDLAREDPSGAVRLAGRSKDVINRGGVKIAPLELEAAYLAHPLVSAAFAVGVPDQLLGERVALFVQFRNGASVSEAELAQWGRGTLEPFKVPTSFHRLDSIPAGATGKADRAALRRALAS
jgi:long-chain acyl-CoA synthetase